MAKLPDSERESHPHASGELRPAVTELAEAGEKGSVLILDSQAILAGFAGEWTLIKEVAELALADCPKRLEEIEKAIANGEAKALQQRAHQLRGTVCLFHTAILTEVLKRLETSGREGDLRGVEEELPLLKTEIERFSKALRAWITTSSTQERTA
jgi:HPt (histidine-containing phosphotransfer) domain-containing protein